MALTDTGINAYAIPKQCKARMPLKPANKFSFLQSPIPSTPFLHLSFPPSLPPLFLSVPLSPVCALGSGPRYQILSHVFARCAIAQRAKKCDTNHIPRATAYVASRLPPPLSDRQYWPVSVGRVVRKLRIANRANRRAPKSGDSRRITRRSIKSRIIHLSINATRSAVGTHGCGQSILFAAEMGSNPALYTILFWI